jgi:hypothetical protein
MKLERIAPESLVAEGVEAKDASSFLQHLLRIAAGPTVKSVDFLPPAPIIIALSVAPISERQQGDGYANQQYEHLGSPGYPPAYCSRSVFHG